MNCWFCEIRSAENRHSKSYVMNGDIDTQKSSSETKVAYNVRHIDIPRCEDCHIRHQYSLFCLAGALVLFLSALAATLFAVYGNLSGWIWALWLGFSIGLLLGTLIVRIAILRGVKTIWQARTLYPEVAELSAKGYRFGHRPKESLTDRGSDDRAGE